MCNDYIINQIKQHGRAQIQFMKQYWNKLNVFLIYLIVDSHK